MDNATTNRKDNWQGMNWIRQSSRLAIYLRDRLACAYCGATVEDGAILSLDHLIPRSEGGDNKPTNLVTACMECNRERGTARWREYASKHEGALKRVERQRRRSIRHLRPLARVALEQPPNVMQALQESA